MSHWTAFIGHALLLSALLWRLLAGLGFPRLARWLPLLVPALMLVPAGGIHLGGYVRGVLGDLSITTLILLGHHLTGRYCGRAWLAPPELRVVRGTIGITGLLFYPLALGVSPLDPYAWGYASLTLPGLLLAAVLGLWLYGLRAAAWLWLAVAAAFVLGLLESTNLWDYLLDPWLVFYVWGGWIAAAGARLRPGALRETR